MRIGWIALCAAAAAAGCGPRVEVQDTSMLTHEERRAAAGIDIVLLDQAPEFDFRVIDTVEAYSCKNLLEQLRAKASRLGADAIVDVSFDLRDTDAFGTNCWDSVYASGVAVRKTAQ